MTKKSDFEKKIRNLRKLAEIYGVEDNPLFQTTLEQYITELSVIALIKNELDEANLAVSKAYIKNRENLYAHPLVKELPRHADIANKTALVLLKIIQQCATIPVQKATDEFELFLAERENM